jgi:hypothetical protein
MVISIVKYIKTEKKNASTSITFRPVKLWVNSTKGLRFAALIPSSWKADTLFGVSVGACSIVGVDAMGAAVEVVIFGTAGVSGGDECDEGPGELYSPSSGITEFDSFKFE